MNFTRTPGCFAIAMIMATAAPAIAAPEDCAAIAAAFTKMGTVPVFHQAVEQDGTSMEMTAIGDTLYMVMDGETTDVALPPGGREKLFAGIFDIITVQDCTALPDESIDGRSTKVFEYVLPPDGALITEAITQRVWIGTDDGLPYKATNPTGVVSITYEGVEAPAP